MNSAVAGKNWHHGHIDEDTLTAFAFRTFYYVPVTFKKFWAKLADQAAKYSKAKLPVFSEINKITPWPVWAIPVTYKKLIRDKETIEPDVVIETNTFILIIEAELTKDFDAGQLVEHFLISSTEYSDKKKEIFHLLLNKTLCYPGELDNTIKKLCASNIFKNHSLQRPDTQRLLTHLLWFNWQSIVEVFQECLEQKLSELETKIINDTIGTILKAENGILLPVMPPIETLKKFSHSKSNITQLQVFLQKIFTYDNRSLLNIQRNKDRITKFDQYLGNVVQKLQGGQHGRRKNFV